MNHCFELVIYRLKPNAQADFEAIHGKVQEALKHQPGFIQFETAVHCEDPDVRVDRVLWQHKEAALAAYHAFPDAPHAKIFMALIDEVLFSGHFEENPRGTSGIWC